MDLIRRYILFSILVVTGSVLGYGQGLLPFACAGNMESYGVHGLPDSEFFWEVEGGQIIGGQGNDTIVIQWDYTRGTHSIKVTELSAYGCFGVPVTANVDINAPVANIGGDVAICEGESFIFSAETNYITDLTYLWSDNSIYSSINVSEPGLVWVQITGADGCSDYDSAYLTLNPLPVVNLGDDISLCGNELWFIDAGNYASYRWSTGDVVNPVMVDGQRTQNEQIWVEVTDVNGCVGSDTLTLIVCDAYMLFEDMPNTITPGDRNGQNDTWVIPNIENFPEAVLEIYDRWGRLIFRTNNVADDPWDGESMSGQEMPMDSYYFVLDLKMSGIQPITGYINVIR